MNSEASKTSGLRAIVLVLITVMFGVASAVILKEAALRPELGWFALAIVFALVVAVNGARFVVWGYIHNRYPLSLSYPLTSMFFPLVLALGYFYGEPITGPKIIGVMLITGGAAILAMEDKKA